MKANEAPEKIILSADRDSEEISDYWVVNDYTDNIKIEYTRTDAFIEKACEWMSSHLQMQYDGFSSFTKDFRKAMKGK